MINTDTGADSLLLFQSAGCLTKNFDCRQSKLDWYSCGGCVIRSSVILSQAFQVAFCMKLLYFLLHIISTIMVFYFHVSLIGCQSTVVVHCVLLYDLAGLWCLSKGHQAQHHLHQRGELYISLQIAVLFLLCKRSGLGCPLPLKQESSGGIMPQRGVTH